MPLFRTRPSGGIATAVRDLVASSAPQGLSALDLIKVDSAAIDNAHKLALADKVRQEAEAMREEQAFRADPLNATRYATYASGMDEPTGRHLAGRLRGDAPIAYEPGVEGSPPQPMIDPQAQRRFQSAIAATIAARLGTGKTNAEQLAAAGGHLQTQRITGDVQDAVRRGDFQAASAMNQGAKPGTQIKLFDNIGSTGATYAPATGAVLADPNSNPLIGNTIREILSKVNQQNAAAGASAAHARLYGVQADKARAELEAGKKGVLQQTDAGLVLVDPITGTAKPILGPDGRPLASRERAPQGYMWGPLNAAGQPTLVKIEGGPVDTGKQLPHSSVKDLAAAGTAVEDTQRLRGSFRDEYGGKTFLGDLSNTYKRVLGDSTGQAQWWQDMDALQNQTRHALFGSALTATELKAWEKTSITPRMSAKQIEQNLQRRMEIEARAASKLGRAYEAAGYNKAQITELLGVGAQYLSSPAAPVAPVTPGKGPGQKVEATVVSNGVTYDKIGGKWVPR